MDEMKAFIRPHGPLGINLNDHVQGLEVQNHNSSKDLALMDANPNQISSLVTLIFLLKMFGKSSTSKEYYQQYCEENYGHLDDFSCQKKIDQDLKDIGFHFSDTMEQFDGQINHARTKRSPRFRFSGYRSPGRIANKFPARRRIYPEKPGPHRPGKKTPGSRSPSNNYVSSLSKKSQDILKKLRVTGPKKTSATKLGPKRTFSKPTSQRQKWEKTMKNWNKHNCGKNRCIGEKDSSISTRDKADIFGELGTNIAPKSENLIPDGSSKTVFGKHSANQLTGHIRGIDHQKFDITNIKSVNTKVNPNIGGKNSNGGINSAQISLPRAKNGGNRPSLISRVEAKYQPHNGQRGNQPKGQGTRDIAKDPCIGGSSNVGTSRFKRSIFCNIPKKDIIKRVDATNVKKTPGTSTRRNQGGIATQKLEKKVKQDFGGKMGVIKGHLKSQRFGGSGTNDKNLVPLTRSANARHRQYVEAPIQGELNKGNKIDYRITAINTNRRPTDLIMGAKDHSKTFNGNFVRKIPEGIVCEWCVRGKNGNVLKTERKYIDNGFTAPKDMGVDVLNDLKNDLKKTYGTDIEVH